MLNHNRPLSYFSDDLNKLRAAGYNPIAVTQLYCEESFVFETTSEALEALLVFNKSEKECHHGWWYGKEEFVKSVENYEQQYPDTKVLIYWL